MVRRLWAALLAAVFLLASQAAAMAENDSFFSEESSAFSLRFGMGAVVETDENQMPVSVNGYPVRQVETCFNVRAVEEKIVTRTDFLDYPFWQPATEYDGNLALMSMFMSLCAARDLMRDENPLVFDPAQNAETYLLSAGFTDLRKDDYSKETSIYTISTVMGSRRMEHEGEDPFTLIAVSVCGGGYKNEWQSNLTAGDGDLHEGFRSGGKNRVWCSPRGLCSGLKGVCFGPVHLAAQHRPILTVPFVICPALCVSQRHLNHSCSFDLFCIVAQIFFPVHGLSMNFSNTWFIHEIVSLLI